MPRQPYRPRPLQWQLFRGRDAVRQGLLTEHQLRSSAWVRVRHDVYADARLDHDHGLACRATGLWLPEGAAIAGPSAACLYGVEHAATFTDDVHVITPPVRRIPSPRGVQVHHTSIAESEIEIMDGLARTTPARTAWDLASWLGLVPAVSAIDGLLRLGMVDAATLRALVESRGGQRWVRRCARAFDLADGRAESPPESALRVRLVLAGLPRPVPQYRVRLPDGSVYRPDLPWPEYRVAVEYDGRWHGAPDQLPADRRRLNRLVAADWIILHATKEHLRHRFPELVRQARTALRERGWRG